MIDESKILLRQKYIGKVVTPIGFSDLYSYTVVNVDKHGRLWSDRGTFMHKDEVKIESNRSNIGR